MRMEIADSWMTAAADGDREAQGVRLDASPEELETLANTPGPPPPSFAGKLIATGGTRSVFAHADNSDQVVKTAHSRFLATANVTEWWNYALLTLLLGCRGSIAPCVEIAPDGSWLIMERTKPLDPGTTIVAPACLARASNRAANWGWLNGRIVCHDYSGLDTQAVKEIMAKPSPVTLR